MKRGVGSELVKDGTMPWQKRGRIRYFVRSVWVGGRTETRYFGRGPAGLLAEQIDEQARERREAQAAAIRSEAARLAPSAAANRALDDACDLTIRATLLAAGFHRPNYSPWRRRRARPAP
jgi:hypothetical protein